MIWFNCFVVLSCWTAVFDCVGQEPGLLLLARDKIRSGARVSRVICRTLSTRFLRRTGKQEAATPLGGVVGVAVLLLDNLGMLYDLLDLVADLLHVEHVSSGGKILFGMLSFPGCVQTPHGHVDEHDEAGDEGDSAKEVEDALLDHGRILDGLADDGGQLLAELVQALLEPQHGDDGVVDLVEDVEVVGLPHGQVDLDPGLGGQGCAGDRLDVKPESVLLRIGVQPLDAVQVGRVGAHEVRPAEDDWSIELTTRDGKHSVAEHVAQFFALAEAGILGILFEVGVHEDVGARLVPVSWQVHGLDFPIEFHRQ